MDVEGEKRGRQRERERARERKREREGCERINSSNLIDP